MTLQKFLFRCFVLLISFALLNCEGNTDQKIRIATAANMQFAMEVLIKSFEQKTNIECEMIVGSSGKLTAQIKEGAPFDLFVSADLKYPQTLFEANLTSDKPKVYAYGNLVLWSFKKTEIFSLKTLQNTDIQHIALANPKTAPYGFAALEVLTHYDLLKKIEHKLVYGESIAQTNQFIRSGAVTLGFTAKSVVLSPKMKGKGSWIALSDTTYSLIKQAVVILSTNLENQEKTEQFYNYLFMPEGQEILRNFGYTTP